MLFSVKYAARSDLFESLKIWENEKFRKLQGSFPVISLSFCMFGSRQNAEEDWFLADPQYELGITNLEVKIMFYRMVAGWFQKDLYDYEGFIRALWDGNVKEMNGYMNRITMMSCWNREI